MIFPEWASCQATRSQASVAPVWRRWRQGPPGWAERADVETKDEGMPSRAVVRHILVFAGRRRCWFCGAMSTIWQAATILVGQPKPRLGADRSVLPRRPGPSSHDPQSSRQDGGRSTSLVQLVPKVSGPDAQAAGKLSAFLPAGIPGRPGVA